METNIDINRNKIVRSIILSGIQRGFFDYESLRLVCSNSYDEIIQILSRPFTNMHEVMNLASLVSVDAEKYGFSDSDILVHYSPDVVEPLMGTDFIQHSENPILFYVAKTDKVRVFDLDSSCVLDAGFYVLTPTKSTSVIFNSTCHRLEGKSLVLTLKKVNPLITGRNDKRIPKHPDEKFIPSPRSVLITENSSDLDVNICIQISRNMYYVCSKSNKKEIQNVSLPFHQLSDHVYDMKLVGKISKMFTVEWICDVLGSHCGDEDGTDCVKTSDLFKLNDLDLASLKILLAGDADYEENSRIVMKNGAIKEFISQYRQHIRASAEK